MDLDPHSEYGNLMSAPASTKKALMLKIVFTKVVDHLSYEVQVGHNVALIILTF